MKKYILPLILLVGLALFGISWYQSFPVSIQSADDLVFNHVSVLYWISLPLLWVSMFLIAVNSKSNFLRWILVIGIILTFFSLYYFFILMPGPDSTIFRGLTEYFIQTKDIDHSALNHAYFQWPGYFVLEDIVTSVSGLELTQYEFIGYTVIGILLTSALYVYVSKYWKNSSVQVIVPVVTFFVTSFSFLNYQNVPFSLALALLFVLFMLETRSGSLPVLIVSTLLFVAISIMHAFVPLFYVLFLFVMVVIKRDRKNLFRFFQCLAIFMIVDITMGNFVYNYQGMLALPSEYGNLVSLTNAPVVSPLDVFVQMFSRAATFLFIGICVVGFLVMFLKRKVRSLDMGILLTGVIYFGVGSVFATLGSRAIPLAFIALGLGASYFLRGKLTKYLKYVFLILIVLSISIPIHSALSNPTITYQTKQEYTAANFMLNNANWDTHSPILATYSTMWYMFPKNPNYDKFNNLFQTPYDRSNITNVESIIYSEQLAKEFLNANLTNANTIFENYNIICNYGSTYIAEKPK